MLVLFSATLFPMTVSIFLPQFNGFRNHYAFQNHIYQKKLSQND